MREIPPDVRGRAQPEARIGDKSIAELSDMSISRRRVRFLTVELEQRARYRGTHPHRDRGPPGLPR